MVLKKQTVWLLTMLTLMVVLSAYYLYNPPVDEVMEGDAEPMSDLDISGLDEATLEDLQSEGIDLVDLEEHEWLGVTGDMDADYSVSEVQESSLDFFVSYRIDREEQQAEQLERYEEMMHADEANAQTVAEATSKWNELQDLITAQEALETDIKAHGYEEAIVNAENEKVNVWVSSEGGLEDEQVLEIIHTVRDQLDVNGNQVYVSYK